VVLANDLSASACEAMKMNIALNGVGAEDDEFKAKPKPEQTSEIQPSSEDVNEPSKVDPEDEEGAINAGPSVPSNRREGCTGRVRTNQGDAW
jgi:tRNA (guanine26-N2/guanine27-N2)-dimethyltransferase